ncbi:MAG: hypothetical protein K2Q09_06350, partial [Phycisphaerales bacterium]|nr:hypothetical protein [Phycisphaerales bacterium]
ALTSDKTQFVQFTPAAGARGSAVMLMDEGAATAQFFAKDLPPVEGGYTLALVDAGGNVVRTIARINTASGRYVEQYAQVRARPGESFVLKAGSRDGAVMKSRNL